jgi:hypothetical protein
MAQTNHSKDRYEIGLQYAADDQVKSEALVIYTITEPNPQTNQYRCYSGKFKTIYLINKKKGKRPQYNKNDTSTGHRL